MLSCWYSKTAFLLSLQSYSSPRTFLQFFLPSLFHKIDWDPQYISCVYLQFSQESTFYSLAPHLQRHVGTPPHTTSTVFVVNVPWWSQISGIFFLAYRKDPYPHNSHISYCATIPIDGPLLRQINCSKRLSLNAQSTFSPHDRICLLLSSQHQTSNLGKVSRVILLTKSGTHRAPPPNNAPFGKYAFQINTSMKIAPSLQSPIRKQLYWPVDQCPRGSATPYHVQRLTWTTFLHSPLGSFFSSEVCGVAGRPEVLGNELLRCGFVHNKEYYNIYT